MQFYAVLISLVDGMSARLDRRDDRGATAVEYGLMVALIAAVIIVAVTLLGDNISSIFTSVANKI